MNTPPPITPIEFSESDHMTAAEVVAEMLPWVGSIATKDIHARAQAAIAACEKARDK